MMTIKQYCYCDLKTRAFIVAVLYLVISAISALGHGIYLLCESNEPTDPISDIIDNARTYEASELFATSLVQFVLNALLLYGIVKDKRFYMLPWIAIHGLFLALLTIGLFIFIFFQPIVILVFIILIPVLYSWHVIFMYYRSMDPYTSAQTATYTKDPQPAPYYDGQGQHSYTNQAVDPPPYVNSTQQPVNV